MLQSIFLESIQFTSSLTINIFFEHFAITIHHGGEQVEEFLRGLVLRQRGVLIFY